MKRLLAVLLALLIAITANADGTLTGNIYTPQSTVPIRNGQLTFTLSQAGVVSGSFAASTSPVYCATSNNGAIVAIKNPLTAPSVSTLNAGGTLAGAYYVKIAYYDGTGVSLPSPVTTVIVGGGDNALRVTAPASVQGATGYKVYVGTTLGSETLQATTSGFVSNTTVTSYSVGSALPSSNTTVCAFTFNDAIIPTSTKYKVNLVDSNGSQVPGFPFYAVFSGTTQNISNGWPTARDVETRYFSPIVASPSSNATQSINSPLSLNGYALSAGSINLGASATGTLTSASSSSLAVSLVAGTSMTLGATSITFADTGALGTLFKFDSTNSSTLTNTYLFFNGSLKQVQVGAADSCTPGFRCLQITN